MKRKVTSIVIALMCTLLVICMSGCSSPWKLTDIEKASEKDGCFKFYYDKYSDYYAIVGDGDEPYPKEVVIPAYYKGKVVQYVFYDAKVSMFSPYIIGPSFKGAETVYFSHTNFIPHYYTEEREDSYCVKRMFFININIDGGVYKDKGGRTSFFNEYDYNKYESKRYNKFYEVVKEKSNKKVYKKEDGETFTIQKANTAYMFNYENACNSGYFFINEFERGGLIKDTPYEPIRAGYKFGGWYKEPECETKWDFATDKLPEAEYDEDGDVTEYIETRLYAKWQKI